MEIVHRRLTESRTVTYLGEFSLLAIYEKVYNKVLKSKSLVDALEHLANLIFIMMLLGSNRSFIYAERKTEKSSLVPSDPLMFLQDSCSVLMVW